MAHRTEGVTEKLMECAKQEFLEKGFANASLRNIAEKAGSSKGAIYVRFTDKESLFSALVKPCVDGITNLLQSALYEYETVSGDRAYDRETMEGYADERIPQMIGYIYDNFAIFKILITGSEGTPYADFVHRLVEIDIEYTQNFFESRSGDFFSPERCPKELMHIVVSSYFSGIFEIVAHDMSREDAMNYVKKLTRFYRAGWKTIF